MTGDSRPPNVLLLLTDQHAAHGYRTALIGKMHFGGCDQMQGFQLRPYGDLRHGFGRRPDPIEDFPSHAAAVRSP